jgi:hypothetical protein
MSTPARYQFVRDRTTWEATITALAPDADGNLLLARLPGMPGGAAITLAGPYDGGASGIAPGPCGAVFVSDTTAGTVVFFDALCNARANLSGYHAPCGLAVLGDRLWIAESGIGHLRRLAFPTLERDLEITAGLQQPTGIAGDCAQRLYVLDRGNNTVRRFLPPDRPDPQYDATIAGSNKLKAPLFLALGSDDRLYVSDGAANALYVYAADGSVLPDLPPPPGCGPLRCRPRQRRHPFLHPRWYLPRHPARLHGPGDGAGHRPGQ